MRCLLLAFAFVSQLGVLAAQETEPPSPADAGTIRELPFEVYLRRSEDGELVLVPDFSLEEYLRLYSKSVGQPQLKQPQYAFPQLSITGEVRGDRAELQVDVTIERLGDLAAEESDGAADEATWISVPLRMGNAVLVAAPQYTGPGRKFLKYDMKSRGYVLWLEAMPGSRHQATLSLVVPVESIGGEHRVRCALPEATDSQFELWVPGESTARVSGMNGGLVEAGEFRGGRTQIIGRGLRGETWITWKPITDMAASTTGIDVDGIIRVAISGPQQLTSEATFVVRPLKGSIASLQVRLPPGMVLRSSSDAMFEYTVSEEDSVQGHIVTVAPRGERGPSGEWNIRLSCELDSQSSDATQTRWEPARFIVLGAARHRGEVRCTVQGQWSVMAQTGPRVVRLADRPLSFRYFAQPPEVTLTVRQRLARGRVEPAHDARVARDRIEMRSRFRYRFAGIRPTQLRIRCPDWELQDVLLDGEPLSEAPSRSAVGEVVVPLPSGGGRMNGLEIELLMQQSIGEDVRRGDAPLRFTLPRPEPPSQGTIFVAPATLHLRSATDVQLVPLAAEIEGLTLDVADESVVREANDTPRIRLHERGGRDAAVFVGAFRVHDRQVDVEEEVVLSGSANQIEWTQYLTYHIRYQVGIRLRLAILSASVGDDLSRVECILRDDPGARQPWSPDETRLEVIPIEDDARSLPDGWRLVEVVLPEPRLGPFLLGLRFVMAGGEASSSETWTLKAPWWIPTDVDGTEVVRREERLTVQIGRRPRVELPSDLWTALAITEQSGQWVANESIDAGVVTLRFPPAESVEQADVIVHRFWVQTWMTRVNRRDRAVWRLTSERPELPIQLPPEVRAGDAELLVLVDGRRFENYSKQGERSIVLQLAPEQLGNSFVLELWYTFRGRPLIGRMKLRAPRILSAHAPPRRYWQVVVPFQEHFWSARGDWSPELRWTRWGELWWKREWPTQESLESWTGAARQPRIPESLHAYTFSALGNSIQLEITTLRRSWLILAASGAVLLFGWLLVSVRQLRHPLTLVGIAACGLAASLAAPSIALTIIQASLVGVACCVVAWWLQWLLHRPHPPRSRAVAEPASGQSRAVEPHPGMTTLSAPAVAPESSIESLG